MKVPQQQTTDFPIVGIGASAGGLEIISKIVAELPLDTGMAFVVIQHLDRNHQSHLTEILSKKCRVQIVEAVDMVVLKPNTVYINSAQSDLILEGNRLRLLGRGEHFSNNLSIDTFFQSLAQERKTKSIGVILTGTGSDGTLGLKSIKAEGGITIAQDPDSAKFDGMPRSAIASGVVDLVLPVENISEELTHLSQHSYTRSTFDDETESPRKIDTSLSIIIDLLRRQTHVNFSSYKVTTINRRIQRQIMLNKMENIKQYCEFLKTSPDAIKALYDDIFIHVTDFFRDPDSFGSLESSVFPALAANGDVSRPIRVWVPGCATGEEAYSIAMSLGQFAKEHCPNRPVQIFATDISEPAIRKARKGVYSNFQIRSLSKEQLDTFFDKVNDGYKVKKSVRDTCIFSRHDLASNPPIPRLDLISCRNVLIYFGAELQKRILPVFHYALNHNGFLWLGRSENPGAMSKLFTPFDKTNKIYTKVSVPTPLTDQIHASPYLVERTPAIKRPPSFFTSARDFQRSADQMVLHKYAPPGAIINSEFEIVQFRGKTASYLELPSGQATLNILKMANPDLVSALRLGLQAAKKQNTTYKKAGISFKSEGKRKVVSIEISPINPMEPARERQYLVLFEDNSKIKRKNVKAEKKSARGVNHERLAQHNSQLEKELEESREYQQSLIEEYESSQEELTSANEELQATNEELQSTNEELGTAKEELQSANEELTSMNDELQKRNSDLSKTEDALRNLNETLEQKVADRESQFQVFADSIPQLAWMAEPDGSIFWYNKRWYSFTGSTPNDMYGWGWQSVHDPEILPSVTERWKESISTGKPFEMSFPLKAADGKFRWFLTRIIPIRNSSGQLVRWFGTNTNIDDQRRASLSQAFLIEAAKVLSSTLDVNETLKAIANLSVKSLSDLCIVDMYDGKGEFTFLAAHAKNEVVELANEFRKKFPHDLNAPSGPARVIVTGKSELYTSVDDSFINSTSLNEEHKRMKIALGIKSAIVVPIQAREKTLGALTLVLTRSGQHYDDQDLILAEELGRRAGISIDNARLFRQTKEAVEARDEFLSIASHELKTPLTSLKLQIQMAERSVDPTKNIAPTLSKISNVLQVSGRQVLRLENLVEDLLDVAKIRSGKMTFRSEEVHLASLIRDVMERFDNQLKENDTPVNVQLDEKIIGFWDRSHIEQVLVNLISNALKYAPKREIQISTSATNEHAIFSVKDSGQGVPKDKQSLIFERFERATSSRKISGLGLGLFISKQIVETHGGHIEVLSEMGHGAEFKVTLPLKAKFN